ncbi:MAG: S8 family serine peptidase [Bacteroidota bacterium]
MTPELLSNEEYSYTDKYSGKKLEFSPKSGEVVATFKEADMSEASETLRSSSSLKVKQLNPRRRFAVLQVSEEEGMETSAAMSDINDQVANQIPVLLDGEGLTRYFIPDECTVQFKEGVSEQEVERINNELGSSIIVKQRTPGYYTISVPEGLGLFETIRQLLDMEEVDFAEPSEFGLDDALDYIPNDTNFDRLWGLQNTGQRVNGTTGVRGADIQATKAWDITRGIRDVIVAVIDTGADMDHPDLRDNILARGNEDWDFAANDSSPDDEGGSSHGTHVSGTVAGVDNNIGIIGVAPGCQIMPLRINLRAGMNANRADAINLLRLKRVPIQVDAM